MTTFLTTLAQEEGTYVISFSLTDEDGEAIIPTALAWTLSDEDGATINDRADVDIDPPVASGDIVLKGADLALQTGEAHYGLRVLTLEGTYNSDLGSGLLLKEEVWFRVDNLVNV